MMLMGMCLIVMAASAWSAAHSLRNIILILAARRRGSDGLAPAPLRE